MATIAAGAALTLASCSNGSEAEKSVKLITLDPGHFHAALVQKSQYPKVSSKVYVYAPEGDDVKAHLDRINGYNTRKELPTAWEEKVYTGPDFFDRMIAEKKGNVMVTAGNNLKKTEYILGTLKAGINVLADKPMAINSGAFGMLEECFKTAEKNGVLLYDIMTERFEITTILQKEFSQIPEIFGEQLKGTPEEPAFVMESVHHFYKNVSGNALRRPAWFYDVRQQGDGLTDVMVHLVDLIQWESFPEQILDYKKDITVNAAKLWPTPMTKEMFKMSTGLDSYPEFLTNYVKEDVLEAPFNGEINYTIKGVNAKVTALWAFEPPAGGGDTHYSLMKGTKANLVIRQGAEQGYKPELYVETKEDIHEIFANKLFGKYPGVQVERCDCGWHVIIPDFYREGHEAHFAQVTENYLKYLSEGKLPEWEVPGMIAKYYITTTAWQMAQ